MFQEELSATVEEYLEHIFKLQEKIGAAKTGDLAKRLGVAPSTVTNVVKWMEERGFVARQPYRGVKLTEKGRRIAIQIVRKHRLAERLLTDLLRMSWDRAHEAACKLEHGLTEEVLELLEGALGDPKTCPHGNPLPTKRGEIIEEEATSLINLNVGERGVVAKIAEEDEDLLKYLGKLKVYPGAAVEVLERAPLDNLVTIRVGRERHTLGRRAASAIYIRQAR
ncbi:MAG: metal-dependent transcriptional regulator [Candidatus Nezhaarchaeota archaeon]|nr:metal-dependent transcriptional regulator [Candidatus Nezhaarchaeota archaeon]